MNDNRLDIHGLITHLSRAAALGTVALASNALAGQNPIQPRMGDPLPGLSAAQSARFVAGKAAFDHVLTAAEGLGPDFNDASCTHCHLQPASGGASNKFVTRFGKAATGGNPFDPLANLGGSLLQAQSINSPMCDEIVPPQANVTTHRITPPTFGFGLVEAIADADILYNQAFPPPGVQGHAHIVQPLEDPMGPTRVGRFGWKAQVATVLSFSGDASLNEMGLTNRLVGTENAPNGDLVRLAQCDLVPDPEDHPDGQGYFMIDRMTDFQRLLAPPPQTPRHGMSGEALFNSAGCSACHLSTPFTSGPTAEPGIANQVFKPYSDFLLHDMGALGDGIVQGQATEQEFRTSPLWGVGYRATFALLHDGRANAGSAEQNMDTAIRAHAGEAQSSRDHYVNVLTAAEQTALQNFLVSLGRAEFDFDFNNTVDEFDWYSLQPLVTGPGPHFTPDDPAAIGDFDGDGAFDLRDFAVLQRAFTGP